METGAERNREAHFNKKNSTQKPEDKVQPVVSPYDYQIGHGQDKERRGATQAMKHGPTSSKGIGGGGAFARGASELKAIIEARGLQLK